MTVKFNIEFSYNNSFFAILELITIIIIIISLYKIENDLECVCADNPLKKGLKGWFIFLIIYNIIFFFAVVFSLLYHNDYVILTLMTIHIMIFIITLSMFVRLFIYIKYLKDNCSCAYNGKEKYIYYYLIIYFSLILFLFFYSLVSLFIILLYFK